MKAKNMKREKITQRLFPKKLRTQASRMRGKDDRYAIAFSDYAGERAAPAKTYVIEDMSREELENLQRQIRGLLS